MKEPGRLLLASAQALELEQVIRASLDRAAGSVEVLSDESQLLGQLVESPCRLLVADLSLLRRVSSLAEIKNANPQTEVILLAASEERGAAVEQLRYGAADYLLCPIEATELIFKIRRVLEIQALRAKVNQASPSASVDELLLLHEATQEISHTWQFEEAFKIVMARAQRLTQATFTKVYLADPSGNLDRNKFLNSSAAQPESFSVADTVEIDKLLFPLAGQAALKPEIVHQQKIKNQPLRSALLVPLISRDKLLGVLSLGSAGKAGFAANHLR